MFVRDIILTCLYGRPCRWHYSGDRWNRNVN